MRFIKYLLLICLILNFFIFTISPVYADLNLGDAFKIGGPLNEAAKGAGYKESTTVEEIIGWILTVVLSFLGVIFLVLMVYGGYNWMTARGNEEQVKKAQEAITAAVIGLVIVILAYAISYLVISELTGATLEQDGTTPPAAPAGTPSDGSEDLPSVG